MIAAFLLVTVSASAASPSTITGKLTGAKLPATGQGVIPVHAMRIRDGRVLGGTYASPSGRFTLKLPGGSYALFGAVVRKSGKTPLLERVVDLVTAKAGKRITIKPSLKKRKAKKKRKRVGARAAFVSVDYPAVRINQFAVPEGELRRVDFGWALSDLLITDLNGPIAECGAIIVERRHLDWVVQEIEVQQTRYFDPNARVQRSRLIASNASVSGSLTISGTTATLTGTYHDERTGRRGTATITHDANDLFGAEQRLAKKLVDIICQHTPRTYAGNFSGTATSTLNQYTITWSGSAVIELLSEHGDPPTGAPAGDYAQYRVREGSVTVKLDGTRGVCTAHGETTLPLAAGMFSAVDYVQNNTDKPFYAINVSPRGDEVVPYTETGDSCQPDPQYPLAGMPFAYTPTPLQSLTGNLTSSTTWDPSTFSHMAFSFSFAPAS